jgi:hypothetical protein
MVWGSGEARSHRAEKRVEEGQRHQLEVKWRRQEETGFVPSLW